MNATVETPERTPAGSEPKTPKGYRVPAHGCGLLKEGGSNGGGRPKKEVRERTLKGYDRHALPWAERVMSDSKIADDHPIKAQAANLLARFGLGTEDKVSLANDEVPANLSQVLASHAGETLTLDLAKVIVSELRDLLGVK